MNNSRTDNTLFNQIINKVKVICGSPIFNFSLTSKELFHSNFIAWLINESPKELFEIMAKYAMPEIQIKSLECSRVLREKKHFDLTIEIKNKVSNEKVFNIIIENKVKSLPNIEQLSRYRTKMDKQDKLLLLTLSLPDFPIIGFTVLTYQQLSFELKTKKITFKGNNAYKTEIVNDYLCLVEFLTDLDNYITTASQYEDAIYDWYIDDLYKELYKPEVRMSDFYVKKSAELLANRIYKEILAKTNADINKITKTSSIVHGTDAEVRIYYKINNEVVLSIELSRMYYRKMIHITNSSYQKIDEFNKLNAKINWLQFKNIKLKTEIPHKQDKADFLKFGDGCRYAQAKLTSENLISEITQSFINDMNEILRIEEIIIYHFNAIS